MRRPSLLTRRSPSLNVPLCVLAGIQTNAGWLISRTRKEPRKKASGKLKGERSPQEFADGGLLGRQRKLDWLPWRRHRKSVRRRRRRRIPRRRTEQMRGGKERGVDALVVQKWSWWSPSEIWSGWHLLFWHSAYFLSSPFWGSAFLNLLCLLFLLRYYQIWKHDIIGVRHVCYRVNAIENLVHKRSEMKSRQGFWWKLMSPTRRTRIVHLYEYKVNIDLGLWDPELLLGSL
jgi:hypothetical protein